MSVTVTGGVWSAPISIILFIAISWRSTRSWPWAFE
jgi:hypothetical protein